MCGRYSLTTSAAELAKQFWLANEPTLIPRFNIAPTQPVGVVLQDHDGDGQSQFRMMRWGLVPNWAKDVSIDGRMINARSETVTTKPSFRSAIRYRRCLIPADGFYEWKRVGQHKQPHRITTTNGGLFAFAGLWEHCPSDAGDQLETCAILTCNPNPLMATIHNRMPVMLARNDYRQWMTPAVTDAKTLAPLLTAFTAEPMIAYPVGLVVNNPKNNNPQCIEPLPQPDDLFGPPID